VARALIDKGFTRVRPLAGGLEAWVEAGRAVEGDAEALASTVFKA
jgi:rhodanese-related sulfurtransferase